MDAPKGNGSSEVRIYFITVLNRERSLLSLSIAILPNKWNFSFQNKITVRFFQSKAQIIIAVSKNRIFSKKCNFKKKKNINQIVGTIIYTSGNLYETIQISKFLKILI